MLWGRRVSKKRVCTSAVAHQSIEADVRDPEGCGQEERVLPKVKLSLEAWLDGLDHS